MLVRFYIDPETERPHVESHGVYAPEVIEVFRGRVIHGPGRNGTRVAEGQTMSGRYLRIIYREDELEGGILVITAYELEGKARAAFRRRQRRKPR